MVNRERPPKEVHYPDIDKLTEPFELPRLIDTPYPSISIGDLRDTTALLLPGGLDPAVLEALEARLHDIKQAIAPDIEPSFYYVSAEQLAVPLETFAARETERTDRKVGVVHLDKFIGTKQTGENFSRLNISRDPDNKIVARTGTIESPEEQLAALVAWARERQFDELLFVDDVVAFGNTFPPLLKILETQLPNTTFRILAGIAASGGTWRGIEKIHEETGIDVEYLTKVLVSPKIEGGSSGLAIPISRDLTVLGGKTRRQEDGTQLSYPYFLPFSKPLPGLIGAEKHMDSAHALLEFNQLYCDVLQAELGRTVTISDLITSGLGIPTSSLACLEGKMELPHPDTPLQDYLRYASTILEDNREAILNECA